ncbi:MAG: endo-1,3-alpha-glucanase family glycosylhydrolase [bacterium]
MRRQLLVALLAGLLVLPVRSDDGRDSVRREQQNTSLAVSFYRLRFQLSTTARMTRITALETEEFLTVRFMGVQGGPDRQGVNMHSMWLGQDAGEDSIRITADYAVTPEALDEPIPYLFEKTGEGSSVLRVFNVLGEETELLDEIHHSGTYSFEFYLDLSALQTTSPLEGEIQNLESEKTLWAFYYLWYELSSWDSGWLQDWPATLYSSDDPEAIDRHIHQAQSAGIDGFIASWWGPHSYTDENLETLLDLAQEKNFYVMIDFETLDGSEPRDEATILEWLRYLISRHGDHPALMKVDGKPVIVLWASPTVADTAWENIFAQLEAEGLEAVFIAMFTGEWPKLDCLEVFDGLHTYNILGVIESSDQVPTVLAQTYTNTGRGVRYYPLLADSPGPEIWAATIQPGYDDHLIPGRTAPILDREDGELYRSTFDAAVGSDPHWIFITTWNEWWEHTYIEPSQLYTDQYLQITREFAQELKGERGDVNGDGAVDVADVLMCVNIILGFFEPTPDQIWAADCSGDGTIDVLDVVGIVNVILGTGTCSP